MIIMMMMMVMAMMMMMMMMMKLPPCLLIDQVDPHRVLFRIEVVKGVIFIPANNLR